jgi:glycine/D-amino acid oxidase-like deaminating enzyme
LKTNYLIVGQGIAGSALALELLSRGKSVMVMSVSGKSYSSDVAAGVYNPINFRKVKAVNHAAEAVPIADAFYNSAERLTGMKFHRKSEIVRIFSSEEERNLWSEYVQNDSQGFAIAKSADETLKGKITAPFGTGIVNRGGVLDTGMYMYAVRNYLQQLNAFREEWFDASFCEFTRDGLQYADQFSAERVIFCEGHLGKTNAIHHEIPVTPTKGEVIHVSIPGLNAQEVINGPVYLAPLGNDLYVCGATFNPGKNDEHISQEGKNELADKLQAMISLPFRIESQFAGVRPAGKDRKPLIGVNTLNDRIAYLNGTGSKGVLYAPMLAKKLANHLENGTEIPAELDIRRFAKRHRI